MNVSDPLKYCELHEWRQARSKATLRTNIKQLKALIGDEDIAGLHYTRLKRLASDLETFGGRTAAPATIKRKLDTLSNALTIATKMTNPDGSPVLLAKPTFPTFEIDNIQERVISDAELVDLFEVIVARREAEPHRDWTRFDAFMRFLLATACRRGEALRVWPGHIDKRIVEGVARHFVIFERYTTKTKKPRIVPLSPEIVAMLPSLRLQAGNGPLFPFTASMLWGNVEGGSSGHGQARSRLLARPIPYDPPHHPDQGHEAIPSSHGVEAGRSRQHPDHSRPLWTLVGR